MKAGLFLKIFGRVQGVSFRLYALEEAKRLKLNGYIKNGDDGSVEVYAEGDEENLASFYQWCYQGSPASEVKNIIEKRVDYGGQFNNFVIRY